ncbi:endonuclease domain-containing protein [Oceanobacillus massiliensis]|uniref:endonuclease domain-containing protein n=1 Tax=Oceanobacillus massiliensis TaxID=1465765 RepID=UPI003018E352
MDMKVIEYIVFFGMAGFALLVYKIYNLPLPEGNDFVDESWKCESPIERRVYNGLLQHGLYPTTQYRVGKYRIDLAFPNHMIAIECDGKAYHSTPKQKAHDRKKDKFLQERGWTVLRFSGSKIHRDLPDVVRRIKEML